MVERVHARLEAEKKDIRDFFKTSRTESMPLTPIDLEALNLTIDNFELSKEVYGEMAMEELDKIASHDELARIKLRNRLDVIQSIQNYDVGWWNMQLLSPADIAKIAVEDAAKTREAQRKREEHERSSALHQTRSQIKKRPTITAQQAEQFQEWEGVRRASMAGGGYAGTAEAEAPEEVKKAVGKAESKLRTGKGFKTATGEFGAKAEAFTAGMSLEKLKEMQEEQDYFDRLDKELGLHPADRSLVQKFKKDYLKKLENSRQRFEKHLELAQKEGTEKDVERLRGLAAKEKELLRDLLKAQISSFLQRDLQ